MNSAPSQPRVQDSGLQAVASSLLVLSSVEHHAGLDAPEASTIDASGGTSVTSAGQPVGTIGQLADYLVNGYWTSVASIAHHWASNTITYKFSNLNASEQSLALSVTVRHKGDHLEVAESLSGDAPASSPPLAVSAGE
jgi:hypothetical protein